MEHDKPGNLRKQAGIDESWEPDFMENMYFEFKVPGFQWTCTEKDQILLNSKISIKPSNMHIKTWVPHTPSTFIYEGNKNIGPVGALEENSFVKEHQLPLVDTILVFVLGSE